MNSASYSRSRLIERHLLAMATNEQARSSRYIGNKFPYRRHPAKRCSPQPNQRNRIDTGNEPNVRAHDGQSRQLCSGAPPSRASLLTLHRKGFEETEILFPPTSCSLVVVLHVKLKGYALGGAMSLPICESNSGHQAKFSALCPSTRIRTKIRRPFTMSSLTRE